MLKVATREKNKQRDERLHHLLRPETLSSFVRGENAQQVQHVEDDARRAALSPVRVIVREAVDEGLRPRSHVSRLT